MGDRDGLVGDPKIGKVKEYTILCFTFHFRGNSFHLLPASHLSVFTASNALLVAVLLPSFAN